MPRKLTQKEFEEKFNKQNKHAHNIALLEDYKSYNTKIKCKCKIDGYEWKATPNNLLGGSGCPKCVGLAKLTHEEFINRLQQVNSNIEILEPYVNSQTKIKCKCKIDEYEWETIPNVLLNGHGCPKCARRVKPTTEEFKEKLYQINPDIEVLGTYINTETKIKCKCAVCKHEWTPIPDSLLHGRGCPKCARKRVAQNQTSTQKEFIVKLQQISPDIEVLGNYVTSHIKIKVKCKKCRHEWEVKPNSLLSGSGCPKCNTSKGEKRVAQYLDNLGINYIYDKPYFKDLVSVNGRPLRPDFIIPSLKIWIEFDGEHHFKPVDFSSKKSDKQVQEQFKIVQQNDQIKNQYAKDNNWTLIRISFTEYDNIEQILAEYIEQEKQVI